MSLQSCLGHVGSPISGSAALRSAWRGDFFAEKTCMRRKLHLSLWMLAALAAVGSLAAGNARAAGAQSSQALSLIASVSGGTGNGIFVILEYDQRVPANDFLWMTVGKSGCAWRCQVNGAAAAPVLSGLRTNPSVSNASIDVDMSLLSCAPLLGSSPPCTVPPAVQMTWNYNEQFIGHGTGTDTSGYLSGPTTTSHSTAITRSTDCTGLIQPGSTTWSGNGAIEYEHLVNH